MTAATDLSAPPRRGHGRGWFDRGTIGLLAALSVIAAALFLAQPVLAGHLMTGDAGARTIHQEIGTVGLGSATLFQAIAAALAFRPRPGRRWPVIGALLLLGAVYVQADYGFAGRVALHVPLGVAMLGLQVWLTVGTLLAWRRRA